jgi:hypothetical protein
MRSIQCSDASHVPDERDVLGDGPGLRRNAPAPRESSAKNTCVARW